MYIGLIHHYKIKLINALMDIIIKYNINNGIKGTDSFSTPC